MSGDVRKLVVLGLAVAVGFTLIAMLLPKLLGAAAGAEVEIITALKAAEAQGIELDVGMASPLESRKLSYQRISVVVQGERAVVTATLDFDGTAKDTAVSSLGAERIPFKYEGGEWVPETSFAPQLQGVVRALEQRRAALEKGDVSRLCSGRADGGEGADLDELLQVEQRKLKALSWLIRSERDGVMVSEESRLSGRLPSRPVDDLKLRRLALQAAAGGGFCFPEGLM